MGDFKYDHHPHLEERSNRGVIFGIDVLPDVSAGRFNQWLAIKLTSMVGTMWCAYAFAALALISLPAAIEAHSILILVSWTAQTFLQLVLLAVIIVGQNIQAAASDHRAEQTYLDAEAVLHEARQIQEHLIEQDKIINQTLDHVQTVLPAAAAAAQSETASS